MTILIVEDEAVAARRLRKLVAELRPSADLPEPVDSIAGTLEYLSQHDMPDLILLDIQLADGSSFEIFQQVEVTAAVIFITAYDDHALRAFRVNATDYLLKPVKRDELEAALDKWEQRRAAPVVSYDDLARVIHREESPRRFLIRIGQQMRLVELEDIAYAYTESKVNFIITHQGRRYPIEYSLEQLEEIFDPRVFFRVNRQYIVNIRAIDEMYAFSKSRVRLQLVPPSEHEIIVSTERSPNFKQWLQGQL